MQRNTAVAFNNSALEKDSYDSIQHETICGRMSISSLLQIQLLIYNVYLTYASAYCRRQQRTHFV